MQSNPRSYHVSQKFDILFCCFGLSSSPPPSPPLPSYLTLPDPYVAFFPPHLSSSLLVREIYLKRPTLFLLSSNLAPPLPLLSAFIGRLHRERRKTKRAIRMIWCPQQEWRRRGWSLIWRHKKAWASSNTTSIPSTSLLLLRLRHKGIVFQNTNRPRRLLDMKKVLYWFPGVTGGGWIGCRTWRISIDLWS